MTEKEFDDVYERWVVQKSQAVVRMHSYCNPGDPSIDPNMAAAMIRQVALDAASYVRDFCDRQAHSLRVQMAEYRTLLYRHEQEVMRLQRELESRIPTVTPVPDTEGRKFREE